ncbi:ATP-binding protein [Muricoccus radiodurans]|uniref:ATP-binding protein n=1 Tax=Muricoccus radiodurans TaxID=2231721 RepID=UPI003CF606CE
MTQLGPSRPFLLTRVALGVILGAAILLALQAAATLAVLRAGERSAIAYSEEAVTATAEAAAASVNRAFLAVDSALAGLPNLLNAALGPAAIDPQAPDRGLALSRVLMSVSDSSLGFRDLILLPLEGGAPIAAALPASRRRPPPLPHASLRAAPAGTTGGPGAGMTIAGPVPNPSTGEWALFFARPVTLRGLPPALAVAEVPVPIAANALVAPGMLEEAGRGLLIRTEDRVLLASAPHDEARIGRPIPRALAEGTEPERIAALRRTIYPSLTIISSQSRDAALAGWRRDQTKVLAASAGFAVLTVLLAAVLLLMLRQREKAERERARGRQLLEAAIEAMGDGFVMWDENDRLLVCNERYRDFYRESAPFIRPGVTLPELMRLGAARGQYPQAGPDTEAFVAETVAHVRAAWNTDPVERLLPDGRWILITERRVPGGGSVGIRTDITQQKRAAADLAHARDEAAAAAAAKSRFLARMSHELRTPLNGVLGMAQALARDPSLGPIQRERAEVLEEAGRHLLAVANDVLDLAHVEAGRIPLRERAIRIGPLLQAGAELARASAAAKGIELTVQHDPSLPDGVTLDPMRLRQLLLNLLSNAIKFTPPGGRVTLRSLRAESDGASRLRLEVLDTGPGIPVEMRASVFRDFVRLERAGDAGAGDTGAGETGAGLGLAIASGIVDAMGGRMDVDDNPEAQARGATGARFWIELPLREAVLDAEPVAAPLAIGQSERPLKILVVDDVATNRLVARALVQRLGHRAELANGGAEALAAVERAAETDEPFDLVLMDLAMPEMDGLEATRRIRALPPEKGGGVAVVALTAGVFDRDSAACREAGMNGYLAKPVTLEALEAELAVARLLPTA